MLYIKKFEEINENSGKRSIRLIKIDSRKRTVELMLINDFTYDTINELIGHGCRGYEVPIMMENRDALFTDEEFLVKEFDLEVDEAGIYDPSKFGFVFLPFSDRKLLIGNGVIIGSDKNRESDDVRTPLEAIRRGIFFVEKGEKGLSDATIWQWDGSKYKITRYIK
jgi:hypothetical protein